jgi:hypothetical protein
MSSEKEAGQVLTSENEAEFYAQKMNLADQSSGEAEVEDSPSEPSENDDRSESGAEKDAKPTEERKQNPKLEKRFSEITKQREQARQEAAQEREARQKLEAEIAAIRQQQQPQQAKNADEKPQPSQFTDAFEYAEALADWSAEQALVRRDKEDLQRRADEAQQKVISSWANKVAAAKAEIPDFDDMVASSGVAVSDPIRDAILESDVGPQILYHLAKEDDLAKKIASMSPYAALREIGKLEAKFEKQPETKQSNPVGKSKAPPPISPIRNAGGGNNAEIGSDGQFHGSYQSWKAARKAGRIR